MRLKIVKQKKRSDIDDLIREGLEKYGSFDSLQHKVQISKCSVPGTMNDYVIWKYLSAGAELTESVVFTNTGLFDVLSPKRAELLTYLANNEVVSIRDLAKKLHRNYKNVYDDLNALTKYELVELKGRGRALKPCCSVTQIDVHFED